MPGLSHLLDVSASSCYPPPSVSVAPQTDPISDSNSTLSVSLLSSIPLVRGDERSAEECAQDFPRGEYDCDGQQVDLREHNTWSTVSTDVSTVELAEVHVVNALAPFVLCSQLKPLMARSEQSFVINVSSMEGKFSRTKKPTHPHTNMAKASMNMLTRTCATEYAKSNIFMNSVDTGWVTYENPREFTATKQELGLAPPIDEVDGAARVLDPVFVALNTGYCQFGLFLKDYQPSKW